MIRMNPDVKVKWLEALRSGEYEQGKHHLRKEDKFCCLGVLCDLAVKEGVIGEPEIEDELGIYGYESPGNTAGLGREVEKWSGVEQLGRISDHRWLYRLNDNGATFNEIADIIEKEL